MTFERLNRIGHDGGPLWYQRLDKQFSGERRERALIFEFSHSQNPQRGAELHFWVEEDKPRLYWYVDYQGGKTPATAPATAPKFVVERVEVNKSRRVLGSTSSYEFICMRALATGEMLGESATSAAYSIFWQNFVEDDGGLHYLHRYADRDTAHYYARQRLLRYIGHDGPSAPYEARHLVEDSMKHDHALAERFLMRLVHERNLVQAIEAIGMTNDDKDTQLANVRRIVELNATRMDHVITRIVEATRDKQGLLGLRACQRVEADPTFFAACDAYLLAHPNGKGLAKMLKPHCPAPKTVWPRGPSSRYDADGVEIADDDLDDTDGETQDAA